MRDSCGICSLYTPAEEEMDSMILKSPVNQKLDSLKEDPTAEEAEEAEDTIAIIDEDEEEKKDEEEVPPAQSSEVRTEAEEDNDDDIVEPIGPPRPERNFDENPTELYLTLMRKDWEGTILRSKDAPEEVSTWIFRKEDNGKLRWKLLPIHACVIFGAPASVVKCLLYSDPSTGMAADDQGMVPLHLAVRMGSPTDVIEALKESAPESAKSKDRKGRTPRDLALRQTGTVRQALLAALDGVSGPVIEEMDADDLVPEKQPEEPTEMTRSLAVATTPSAVVDSPKVESPKMVIRPDPALAAKVHLLELQLERSEKNSRELQEQLQGLIIKEQLLQAEHAKLQETSTQATTTYVEAETANKAVISNLVNQVGDLQGKVTSLMCEKTELEGRVTRAKEEFDEERQELKAKVVDLEKELASTKFLHDEADTLAERLQMENAELKSNKERHIDEMTKLRESVAEHEIKLEEVTLSEQELAWKNSSLQETIKNMPDPVALNRQLESLESEKKELKSTVHKLSVKLYKVVGFLDEMVQEQDAIIAESLTNTDEASMATDAPDDDRQKLLSNVSGMKEQIGAVIESVIGNMPDYRMNEEDDDDEEEA